MVDLLFREREAARRAIDARRTQFEMPDTLDFYMRRFAAQVEARQPRADYTIAQLPTKQPAPIDLVPFWSIASGQTYSAPVSEIGGGSGTLLGIVNVQSYGATGNGVTDDTAFIQSAYNALVAGGGGILYFPPTLNGYYITAQIVIAGDNVLVAGVPSTLKWTSATGGTKILLGSTVSTSAFNFLGNNCGMSGLYFSAQSGTTPTLIASVGAVNGFSCDGVYATSVGGIACSGGQRMEIRNTCLQGYYGAAGFSLTNVAISFLENLNASPATTGTAVNFYLSGGGSHDLTYCKSQSGCLYGLQLINNTHDNKFNGMECNGATGTNNAQIYINGCTDNVFINTYISQPAAINIWIVNSAITQFIGGWSETAYRNILIDGVGGSTHDLIISGMRIDEFPGGTPADLITFQHTCFDCIVTGCNLFGAAQTINAITDNSTQGTRRMNFSGNTIDNFANAQTIVISNASDLCEIVTSPNAGQGYAVFDQLVATCPPQTTGVSQQEVIGYSNTSATGGTLGWTSFGSGSPTELIASASTEILRVVDVGNALLMGLAGDGSLGLWGKLSVSGTVYSSGGVGIGGAPTIQAGTAAPTFSANKGSIFLRSGSGASSLYVNTSATSPGTTWTAVA